MGYIEFDKKKLVNLSYALSKEILQTNRSGAYSSSTLIGCNTRKYHGLLVAPQPQIDHDLHVFLSALDISVIQHDKQFNLGVHKYPGGVFEPKGHKYIDDFVFEPVPNLMYRVGGVQLEVQKIFAIHENRVMLKMSVMDCHSPVNLRLKPYLAFRQRHRLNKANTWVNKRYRKIENGIGLKMYEAYDELFMQLNKHSDYVHVPDWYYNVEYSQEQKRGYDYQEDLYVPGYFEVSIKKGESIIFSAALSEAESRRLKADFDKEVERRQKRTDFKNCLHYAAEQFIVENGKFTSVVAGYPWFGRWGRDTFIALPGLTLSRGDIDTCTSVIDSMLSDLKEGLFPNIGVGDDAAFNSVDAPMWFFWTLQQLGKHISDQEIWRRYGKAMQSILNQYSSGNISSVTMNKKGLIWSGEEGKALTWMDAMIGNEAVTPRRGYCVEINALWYHAIMYSLVCAKKSGDEVFVDKWKPLSKKIPKAFREMFWDADKGILADVVDQGKKDFSLRPNQIFAVSLINSPISEPMRKSVIDSVFNELLTPRGIRTLNPFDKNYQGIYSGDQTERDAAYHQGTVWPWLFGHFVEAYLKVYKQSGVRKMRWYLEQYEDCMNDHGIGSISEVYDGNPPHKAGGCISQAWSVSEIIRAEKLISALEQEGQHE